MLRKLPLTSRPACPPTSPPAPRPDLGAHVGYWLAGRPATVQKRGAVFGGSILVLFVKITTHVASRGSSQKEHSVSEVTSTFRSDHYPSSLHHLSKSDFRHHLIPPVLISLSSLDLCFTPLLSLSSSRVISIF